MFMEERHREVIRLLEENGRISVGEIQELFGVSNDSARRDLRMLEGQGLLKRTHGGAIPLQQVNLCPPRNRAFGQEQVCENYDTIARHTAGYIRENDVVYLTSGSLGFLMLSHLPRNISFTLVLNSISLANELKLWDNLDVYVAGGKMRMHSTASVVDSFATAFVRNMHFDLCLMTGAGVSAAFGLSNNTGETAEFQRTVISNSRRKVLMMPSGKIGFKAFIKVCDINSFDELVTDWDAVEDELARIEEAGVRVTVVDRAK